MTSLGSGKHTFLREEGAKIEHSNREISISDLPVQDMSTLTTYRFLSIVHSLLKYAKTYILWKTWKETLKIIEFSVLFWKLFKNLNMGTLRECRRHTCYTLRIFRSLKPNFERALRQRLLKFQYSRKAPRGRTRFR